MRELLERWAKDEPERCGLRGSFALVKLSGTEHSILSTGLLSSESAVVLAAVIEAIEARRWRYRFWGDLGMREAIVVTVDERTDGRERHGAGGPNLPVAAVLLSAYLSALEADRAA